MIRGTLLHQEKAGFMEQEHFSSWLTLWAYLGKHFHPYLAASSAVLTSSIILFFLEPHSQDTQMVEYSLVIPIDEVM